MMKRLLITAILPSFVLLQLAACARDSTKEVRSAESEYAQTKRENNMEENQLTREQENERAALKNEQMQNKAEVRAENKDKEVEAAREVDDARVKMNQERQEYSASARERLTKIDARAQELQTQSKNAPSKTRRKVKSDLQAFPSERNSVESKLSTIESSNDTSWKSAKEEVDQGLKNLEDRLDRVESKL